MPNWCYTEIHVSHEDSAALLEFSEKLKEWTSENARENGFGKSWLGNIVLNSGIGTVGTGADTDLYCRGSFEHCFVSENSLDISTETAWGPMLKMWIALFEKYLPGYEMTYAAAESGMGEYFTSDPALAGKYIIDSWDQSMESCAEADEDDLRAFLQKALNVSETDIEKLLSIAEAEEREFSIHKWEFVPAEEMPE